MSLKILLVDDDPESLGSTEKILRFSDHDVVAVDSGMAALESLKIRKPDLVITDVRMPGMSGFEFVETYQKSGFSIPFIVMTAFGEVKDAVWAMKMGAVDFLLKPFKRQSLLDAIESLRLRIDAGRGRPHPAKTDWIGSSRAMKELRVLIEQVARTDASEIGRASCRERVCYSV
jgi:DNA-binding NtrC family response regulator